MNQQNMNIFPIVSLSPYRRGKWTIKVVIIRIGDTKTYQSAKFGPGKLLNLDLKEFGGDDVIRLTLFNSAVDRYAARLVASRVYFVRNCQIKRKNLSYNRTIGSDFELTLGDSAGTNNDDDNIVEVVDEQEDSRPLSFALCNQVFVGKRVGEIADNIVGIVSHFGPLEPFTTLSGGSRQYFKREVRLTDRTGSVSIVLWNDDAQKFQLSGDEVHTMLLSGGILNEYAEMIHLVRGVSGVITVDPHIEYSDSLKAWCQEQNRSLCIASATLFGLPLFSTLYEFHNECLSALADGDKSEKYCRFVGMITFVGGKGGGKKWCKVATYRACINCNLKVHDWNSDHYCEKCFGRTLTKERLAIDIFVRDAFGKCFVVAIGPEAESILGLSVDEYKSLNLSVADIKARLECQRMEFCIARKVGNEYYNRPKGTITLNQHFIIKSVRKLPSTYKEYNKYLINEIIKAKTLNE